MSETGTSPRPQPRAAQRALKASGILWFLVALTGQWLFVAYIAVAYGLTTAAGDYAAWDDTGLIMGFAAGDAFGNFMFAAHVLLAAVVTIGGSLQLIPTIRHRIPVVHRWNGRIFMIISVFMAVGGLWMVWGRGARLSEIGSIGLSIDGILILVAAAIALNFAVRRQIDSHRRWAMRLFILVNAVWFYRLGFMAWIILMQGPVGVGDNLDGPFDITISFLCYLLPLAVLELYMRACDSTKAAGKWMTTGLMLVGTAVTALGIFGAWMFMWSPNM
jgi:hypothetical protein